MLTIQIPETELFDENEEEFVPIKATTIRLEHSLVSVSKWESKWKKPFLKEKPPKTLDEVRDYVRCMTLTQNVNPKVYYALTKENFVEISNYINANLSATWFNDKNTAAPSREIITSEIIYYQMVAFGIPFECQKWHLSRLLTLIRICSLKNQGDGKKMSQAEVLNTNRKINAARRAAMHSKG